MAKSKVWVIDPAESGPQKSRSGKMRSERTVYSPDVETPAPTASSSRARVRRKSEAGDEKGSPLLALLAYLAGPLAILTTRRGRESRFWVALAILSCLAGAVILLRANRISTAPHESGAGFLMWLSVASLAMLMGSLTWARAVFLLGRNKGQLLRRLPGWVRHPGTAGILGLVIPGFGLFISQHPRRAACAVLIFCAMAVSALVLWQAPALWLLSQAKGILAGYGDTLECMFLVMGAIGLFGALAWIVQALDGARLAGHRIGNPGQPRGDWAAAALIAAIAALLMTVKPSHVAETLDRCAVSARQEGLRIIPLQAAQAAMRLDPSRPEYAVQAIEINEALGRKDAALALRRELAERWMPYERMLRLEAALIENAVLRPENP